MKTLRRGNLVDEGKSCFLDKERPCDKSCMAFLERLSGDTCSILHKLDMAVKILGREPQGSPPTIKHTTPPKV